MIIIALVVLAWVAWALYERQKRPATADGMSWLEYGFSLKAVGAFFAVMLFYAPTHELLYGRTLPAIVVGSFTVLLGGPIFLLAFFWRVGYDASGIHTRSPWRKSRFVPWTEVTCFRFSSMMKQWVVHTRSQGTIRINELVPGVRHMVSELKKRRIAAG
jgi:hypothetical protein